jgi:DNA-directed RNA polymerase subunit RPC12/RpoP
MVNGGLGWGWMMRIVMAKNLFADGQIDDSCTDEIVCPYCGEIIFDSSDYDGDEGEIDCGECGKTFTYQREYSCSYWSYKVKGE